MSSVESSFKIDLFEKKPSTFIIWGIIGIVVYLLFFRSDKREGFGGFSSGQRQQSVGFSSGQQSVGSSRNNVNGPAMKESMQRAINELNKLPQGQKLSQTNKKYLIDLFNQSIIQIDNINKNAEDQLRNIQRSVEMEIKKYF